MTTAEAVRQTAECIATTMTGLRPWLCCGLVGGETKEEAAGRFESLLGAMPETVLALQIGRDG